MHKVVAVGGNALIRQGGDTSYATQMKNAQSLRFIREPTVIVHGNGPQVGLLARALQKEDIPLTAMVAMTQGLIGALITEALEEKEKTVCVVTHVQIEGGNLDYTKPVGMWLDSSERQQGLRYITRGDGKYRRVVPSPCPTRVRESSAIKALLSRGFTVIAGGGGGIAPLDGVVDKDAVAALLAVETNAKALVILTDVPGVYRNYGTESQQLIAEITSQEARALLPSLPAGSMRPKLEACCSFVESTGRTAVIGALDDAESVMTFKRGTKIKNTSKL